MNYWKFTSIYSSTISDSYFRITQFRNLSRFAWRTHHMEIVLNITITASAQAKYPENCYLKVEAVKKNTDIYPLLNHPLHMHQPTFRLRQITPPLFFPEEVGQREHPYFLLIHSVTTNWNAAEKNCSQQGMELMKVDSLSHWDSLMEKTHRVFQREHFAFWKSHIIFIQYNEYFKIYVSIQNTYNIKILIQCSVKNILYNVLFHC